MTSERVFLFLLVCAAGCSASGRSAVDDLDDIIRQHSTMVSDHQDQISEQLAEARALQDMARAELSSTAVAEQSIQLPAGVTVPHVDPTSQQKANEDAVKNVQASAVIAQSNAVAEQEANVLAVSDRNKAAEKAVLKENMKHGILTAEANLEQEKRVARMVRKQEDAQAKVIMAMKPKTVANAVTESPEQIQDNAIKMQLVLNQAQADQVKKAVVKQELAQQLVIANNKLEAKVGLARTNQETVVAPPAAKLMKEANPKHNKHGGGKIRSRNTHGHHRMHSPAAPTHGYCPTLLLASVMILALCF